MCIINSYRFICVIEPRPLLEPAEPQWWISRIRLDQSTFMILIIGRIKISKIVKFLFEDELALHFWFYNKSNFVQFHDNNEPNVISKKILYLRPVCRRVPQRARCLSSYPHVDCSQKLEFHVNLIKF